MGIMFGVECGAVMLALLCVLMAISEKPLSWVAAGVSAALYCWLFYSSRLYTEAVFQILVIILSVKGYRDWSRNSPREEGTDDQVRIRQLHGSAHLAIIVAGLLMSATLGVILQIFSDTDVPFFDSAITVFSTITTFLATRKVLENWLYWLFIDAASVGIYLIKGLFLTAGLYGLYIILAVVGYREWLVRLRSNACSGIEAGETSQSS